MVTSKQSLFALLLFGIVAVHGLSQIRFANTQQGFYSYLGLATYPDGPISGLQLENFGQLPLTDYVSLPISGSATITFYVHDFTTGEDSAFVNVTLLENRSYTFVAAGSTVPLTLFSVEERIPYGSFYAGKAVLTIINALDSTLGSPFTLVVSDGYGTSYPQVPFGTSGVLVLNSTSVDVFASIAYYYYDLALNLFLQPDATTYLYLRGINGSTVATSSFVIPFSETNPEVPAVQPVASPVGDSAPVSAQQTARIRLINGAYVGPNTRITAVMRTNSVQNATSVATSALELSDNIFGEYITVPSSVPVSFFIDSYGLQYTVVLPTDSLSSLVFYNSNNTYTLLYLNETPVRASYPANPSNVMYRVVNLRQGSTLSVYSGWYDFIGAVNFGSFSDFVADNITVWLSDYHGYLRTLQGQYDFLTTIYVVGRVQQDLISIHDQTPLPPPINNAPVCVNGYVETTGYCNCYSGFADDIYNPNAKCTEGSPYWCSWQYSNTSTNPTDTGAVPSLNGLYVASGKLGFSVISAFYSNRRTLIELPNSSCNLINNPDYYYKSTGNCVDQYFALLPFTTCGFTKSSTSDADTYRAQVHVKHIDTITVNDRTVDRVIDTPFTIVIRLPKNIAIEASVEVIAAPVYTVPLTASLVAQQVNTATQTAKLVYIASVPAQFYVQSAYVQQRPYGVNTTLSVSTTNCTSNYCVQYLTVDVSINNCEISGFYSFDVTISCRNQQNCPTDVQEAPVRATIASNILAQRSCGDASVDVGLQGSLNAYDSISFNNQALSFGPEQQAYFLVNTYSSEVSISQVTLDQVYYQGPNVAGHFLLTNGANVSSRAVHNNFTWGQLSSSQLWFSFDVTVSKLLSSEDTMFKLDNGQRGVYSFIAVVEVEWLLEGTPTAGTPITLPVPASVPSSNNYSPYSFKKRMTLQGTVSQGSQFTAQVQVAGPSSVQSGSTQPDDGAVSAGTNITALFSLCGALLVLLQL